MAADPVILVNKLHNELLQTLAVRAERHFTGLQAAARFHKGLPSFLRRRLSNLDICYNVLRHITSPFADGFKNDIDRALSQLGPHPVDEPMDLVRSLSKLHGEIEDFRADLVSAYSASEVAAGVDTTVDVNLEQMIVSATDDYFKTLRGTVSSEWPPVAGLTESESRELIFKRIDEGVIQMLPKVLSASSLSRARTIILQQCDIGFEAWKRFASNNAKRKAEATQPDVKGPSKLRLKAVTKR